MPRRLAVDGGAPAFAEPRYVGTPNIVNRGRFHELLDDALDRRWLTNRGPFVHRFEEMIAERAGVPHAITVTNATVGLELLLRAMDVDGEVIVPSYTFVATAHAVRWLGMRPVFADVDPTTHLIDPWSVRRVVTSRTRAILGVHLWGRAADDAGLRAVADDLGVPLVYDGAHALGSTTRSGPVLALGDAAVVSFHATKFLSSFEGGAVVTDDGDLAERIRRMSNFGFAGRDQVDWLGTNAKLSEVHAAMGIAQLEVIDETLAASHHRMELYAHHLRGIPGLRLLTDPPGVISNGQYIVVEVDAPSFGRSRDELVDALEAENVMARRYFWPCAHRMQPYLSEDPNAGLLLPETERLAGTVIVLPTGTAMSERDIEVVCQLLAQLARPGSRPGPSGSRSPVAVRPGHANS